MKKYSSLIIVLFVVIVLLTIGYFVSNPNTSDVSMDAKHKYCTRSGDAGEGVTVNLYYDVYYKGKNIELIKSVEEVETTDQEKLDSYEDSYRTIHEKYKNLKYYDTQIVRTENKVTSKMDINYAKLDINQLLAIEGDSDNIIQNGKANLSKWLKLAKKFGATCKNVDD